MQWHAGQLWSTILPDKHMIDVVVWARGGRLRTAQGKDGGCVAGRLASREVGCVVV
jgi:hypothetical protein